MTIEGVKALDSFTELTEIAAPGAGAANKGRLYGVDRAGYTTLEWVDSAGVLAQVSHPPAVRAFSSSNQTLTNIVVAALAFANESFDTDAMHDNSTNNSRLTAKTAGIYYIEGQAEFALNGTGDRFLRIFLNNTSVLSESRHLAAGGAHRELCGGLFALAVNDYVELIAFQSSGGDLIVNPARFYMFWVAPTP